MSGDETGGVRCDTADGRVTITLERVAHGNTLTRAMLARLVALLETAAADTSLRVLVLSGAGERDFCLGSDPEEVAGHTAHAVAAHDFDRLRDRVSGCLASLPALTVARIGGRCGGGGLSLALACDLRVASETAEVFYPALANHVLPTATDVERLCALIGPARAKLLLLCGQTLSAEQALAWRLLDTVVPAADLDTAVETLCAPALAAAAHEVMALKRLTGPRSDYTMVDLCYRAMYDNDEAARRRLREG